MGSRLVVPMLVVAAIFAASAGRALADAVPPTTIECPPGLDPVRTHSGGWCVPRGCGTDEVCGRGAACREVHECMAIRRRESRFGTSAQEERVGLCDADGTCDEGRCRVIHQCEPTGPAPGWDRRRHEWRGRRHASVLGGGLVVMGVMGAWVSRRTRR